MKEANVYLIFNGNCAEAMEFYEKSLGAELQISRFGDMPGGCPEGMQAGKDRVMHARLGRSNHHGVGQYARHAVSARR